MDGHEEQQFTRESLLIELRKHGIRDERVLKAFEKVPREAFIAEDQRPLAYRNAPLPIGEGQTISQPFVVAFMLQEVELCGRERALEVGAGSGYQTAILAELVAEVVAVERHASLAETARERLAGLGYRNVTIHVANGSLGWPATAPYDAIVVSAAAPTVPGQLLEQLAEGGRLILPVGSLTAQDLVIVRREKGKLRSDNRGAVRFVPLVGEEGWGGRANGESQ